MPKIAPVCPIWPHLERYSPLRVRLWSHWMKGNSRRTVVWPSHAEIAIAAGLTMQRVVEISALDSWDDVTFGEMKRFCAACRFDPTVAAHRHRVAEYERQCLKSNKPPFPWLKKSPRYETEVRPLLRVLTSSPASHVA